MVSDALIAARVEHHEQQVRRIKFNAAIREGMIRDASGR